MMYCTVLRLKILFLQFFTLSILHEINCGMEKACTFCNELILLSARYEIRAACSEDCGFVPPNLYDVTAP